MGYKFPQIKYRCDICGAIEAIYEVILPSPYSTYKEHLHRFHLCEGCGKKVHTFIDGISLVYE